MNKLNDIVYIVGKGRVLKLLVLLILCGGIAAVSYYYLMPTHTKILENIKSTDNDIRRLRAQIEGMPDLLKEYQDNEVRYESLLQNDFISDQDRIQARRRIDKIRAASNLVKVQYDISPISFEKDFRTNTLSHNIGKSSIGIVLGASVDLEAYAFMHLMEEYFPGVLLLKSLSLRKTEDVNEEALVKIGRGETVAFMEGEVEYEWYTLVEKTEDEQRPEF